MDDFPAVHILKPMEKAWPVDLEAMADRPYLREVAAPPPYYRGLCSCGWAVIGRSIEEVETEQRVHLITVGQFEIDEDTRASITVEAPDA